ncbi:hypothetical protein HZA99_04730 [Candidatus Woesearchaeota archaeon]|nr:hypothetical protein [Candidatus Woesearchaeota archaeon]
MKSYQKWKCANCGHEFISGAEKPRCSKCFSTRINKIEQFSLEKEIKPQTKTEVKTMPEIKPKPQKKQESKYEETEEEDNDKDDVDSLIWG